jgi:hypothetical protein
LFLSLPTLLSSSCPFGSHSYTFADEFSEAISERHSELSIPLLASQFIAFVLYLLTGWQHHQSVDGAKLFSSEKSKSIRLFNYMVTNGVPLIDCHDIVDEHDEKCFHFKKNDVEINKADEKKDDENTSEELLPTGQEEEGEETNSPNGSPLKEGNEEENLILKTKRRFKEEYIQRKAVRDDIIEKIYHREEKIENICHTISKGSFEIFFVTKYDLAVSRYRVYPVLGLSYEDNHEPSYDNIQKIRFLLQWKRENPIEIIPNVNDPIILGKGRLSVPEFQVPFPLASPISYLWHNVTELIDENAFLTALFTNIDTPYNTDPVNRHWNSLNPEPVAIDPKAAKEKQKTAKDPKSTLAVNPADDGMFIDSGSFPITFLKVDPSLLFDAMEPALREPSSEIQVIGDETDLAGKEKENDKEIQDALKDQSEELNMIHSESSHSDHPDSSNNHPTSHHDDHPVKFLNNSHHPSLSIKLILTLVADMTSDVNTADSPEGKSRANSMSLDAGKSPSAPNVGAMSANMRGSMIWDQVALLQNKIHPSDTSIILQEIRFDDQLPLMFVMKMKDTAHLPILSKAFTIPSERITSKEPILFWVRIFTKCSIHLNISSNVTIQADLAEKIWKDSLGFSTIVAEGDSDVTIQDSEQFLFRLPIQIKAAAASSLSTSHSSTGSRAHSAPAKITSHSHTPVPTTGNEEVKEGNPSDHPAVFPFDPHLAPQNEGEITRPIATPSLANSPKILIFLFVKELAIEKLLKLLLVNMNKHNCDVDILHISHPLGQVIPLCVDINHLNNLVGYIQSKTEDLQIPKFHWKLLVLSKDHLTYDLEQPSILNGFSLSQRFSGKYISNSSLRIFRDIYSIEKTSFPIAFKLMITSFQQKLNPLASTIPPPSEEEKASVIIPFEETKEDFSCPIHYVLRLYKKSDLSLVAEYGVQNTLHCYSLDLSLFVSENDDSLAGNGSATDLKGGKPPAGKAPAPAAAAAGKGGKGVVPVAVDAIDVIFECTLDLDTMIENYGPLATCKAWKSVFPHVFDEFFPSFPEESNDAIAYYSEILSLQKSFLALKPPETPLLSWKLDILAGKVSNVSHDISLLQSRVDLKKSWESSDASGNRIEKALASAAYVKEREELKRKSRPVSSTLPTAASINENNENASLNVAINPNTNAKTVTTLTGDSAASNVYTGTQGSIEMTSSMVESLSQALALDADEVKNRFSTLHKVAKVRSLFSIFLDSLLFMFLLLLD